MNAGAVCPPVAVCPTGGVVFWFRSDLRLLSAGDGLQGIELARAHLPYLILMDMNLPEGYLFMQIRALFPKQSITPMHLLALMGDSVDNVPGVPGIGVKTAAQLIGERHFAGNVFGDEHEADGCARGVVAWRDDDARGELLAALAAAVDSAKMARPS